MKRPGKKAKILIGVLTPAAALITALAVLCFVTMGMYSPTYLGRVFTHWDSKVSDYEIFPARVIQKSGDPYTYEREENPALAELGVKYSGKQKPLSGFVKSTDTTSFIIVKDDKIVYEQYANGYDENSVNTSFSMAKSVVSLLVCKAEEDGYVKSVTEPIESYITEFKGKDIGKVTIEDLLLMRSPIVYEENKFLWFGDDSLTYWHPDLRKLALSHTKLTDGYKGRFHYNNYHPLLLGIILERATGVSVSEYFSREIWQKIGARYDATWSLDGKKSRFEKMESGINFRAVDFVKIGSAVLHNGYFNGARIISADRLSRSALCSFPLDGAEYEGSFLAGRNIGYKYMWYSTPSPQSGYDIIAWGKSDQILYISPANGAVALRTGKTDGGVKDWITVLQSIISAI